MSELRIDREEDIALLVLDRPVANTLSTALCRALQDALAEAIGDDSIRGIVLCGSGTQFSNGVDIAAYDQPQQRPRVDAICRRIETAPKPVVAALNGAATGAGFELALAAHARIAAQGSSVGMPDIRLGLIPNAGATQRLPRLAGIKAAIDLLLSGRVVPVSDPIMAPVMDQICAGPLRDAAIETARQLADAGAWPRPWEQPAGWSDPLTYQKTVSGALEKFRRRESAETDILKCLEAAQLLPFERGLELEQTLFEERLQSPEARGRRHFRAAERRTMIMPERADGKLKRIRTVALPGSSPLVTELAVAFLDAGLNVSLFVGQEETRQRIRRVYDGAVNRKAISAEARDQILQKLQIGAPDTVLAQCDLAIDTGQIDLSAHYDALHPGALWVSVGADAAGRVPFSPEFSPRHVSMHIYRPVLSLKLSELCVFPETSADTVISVAQLFNLMGHTVIRCSCVDGLVGGNMSAALFAAALRLAQTGIGPYRIDASARALGFHAGPFQLMDREGLPQVAARLHDHPDVGAATHDDLLQARIRMGATGRTAGRGFYLYADRKVSPDRDLMQRNTGPIGPQTIDARAALEAALVNEAARLVSAEVVSRASDIDVLMVAGFGFDPSRGGPLFQAGQQGMFNVFQTLQRLEALSPPLWRAHNSIVDMVKNGEGFFGRPA